MERLRETWLSVREVLANTGWAFRLSWSTNARLFTGILAASLIQSLLPAGVALATRALINSVSDALAQGSDRQDEIILWLVVSAVIAIAGAGATNAKNFFTQRLRDELELDITTGMLEHAAVLDFAFFEDPNSRDMLHRARNNMARHVSDFLTIVLSILSNLVQIVSLLIILMAIQPIILLLLLPVSGIYVAFQWGYARMRFAEDHARANKTRWLNYYVSQLMDEQRVAQVKLLGLQPLFIERFREIMGEFLVRNKDIYRYGLVGSLLFTLASFIVIYYAFGLATFEVIAGGLTIGDVAIYGGAVVRLRSAAESTIGWLGSLRWQTLFVSNLAEFLSIRPRIAAASGSARQTARGDIEIRGVHFTYPGGGQPALQDVSLHIEPGETVAVVGENGAGKTTLVKLLARLYDPDAGSIEFDGADLRSFSQVDLHRNISFVFQHFGRYAATAGENIAFGDWEILLDDPEGIERIARAAGVHEMITAMPHGYDTLLGRDFGEYDLSGGQWQRLAIARAFARNPALLILDEPTANLDARAEFQLYTDFKQLARGRTTILISHRFSTVRMADRIIVMDAGTVIENGTHEALIAQNGHYAMLYDLHRRQMTAGQEI